MGKTIYFDHNATTPVHPEAVKAMQPYLSGEYGNASSMHAKGRSARKAVDEARAEIASALNTEPSDIIFTASGTEADNMAVKGACLFGNAKGRHIITGSVEHMAVLATCKFMEKNGFEVTYLPVDKTGQVCPEDLKKAIRKETVLVSIMHANNETGTIVPIEELAKITKEKGVLFHTDAVQTFGKLPIDLTTAPIDLLSASAHKIYGPKGVGALFIRKGVKLLPLIHGGHHERNLRAGTENVPAIAGFGKAVELAMEGMGRKNKKLTALRDKLHKGITESIEDVRLNGHPAKRLPGTLNLSFQYIEGESIILNLDFKGICVSSGSACTSGSLETSHVLKAMGVPADIAQGSVRFSLGEGNTEEDVDYCVEVLPEIVRRLRSMSPLRRK